MLRALLLTGLLAVPAQAQRAAAPALILRQTWSPAAAVPALSAPSLAARPLSTLSVLPGPLPALTPVPVLTAAAPAPAVAQAPAAPSAMSLLQSLRTAPAPAGSAPLEAAAVAGRAMDGSAPAAEADLLPDLAALKSMKPREARRVVYENLDAYLARIPALPADVTVRDLDRLPLGSYRLAGRPSVDFVRSLLEFRGDRRSEVSLDALAGSWLLTLSEGLATNVPEVLRVLGYSNLFSLAMHTHPPDRDIARIPSWPDLDATELSADRTHYVVSRFGLSEFRSAAKSLPGNWDHNPVYGFLDWLKARRVKTTDEFRSSPRLWVPWAVKFLKEYFGFRTIPWEDRAALEAVLAKGDDPAPARKPYRDVLWNQGWLSAE